MSAGAPSPEELAEGMQQLPPREPAATSGISSTHDLAQPPRDPLTPCSSSGGALTPGGSGGVKLSFLCSRSLCFESSGFLLLLFGACFALGTLGRGLLLSLRSRCSRCSHFRSCLFFLAFGGFDSLSLS